VKLCIRLGWRGREGFDRLQKTPARVVRDFLLIAECEEQLRKK
jgi:hypothetical protein